MRWLSLDLISFVNWMWPISGWDGCASPWVSQYCRHTCLSYFVKNTPAPSHQSQFTSWQATTLGPTGYENLGTNVSWLQKLFSMHCFHPFFFSYFFFSFLFFLFSDFLLFLSSFCLVHFSFFLSITVSKSFFFHFHLSYIENRIQFVLIHIRT